MAEATEFAIGDIVVARFTERGKTKTVRAHITEMNAKRGKVEINWVHTSSSGGGFSMSQKKKWVARADVRKVAQTGEPTPNEVLNRFVKALAGVDHG